MNIILTSLNPSKKRSLEMALKDLNIDGFEITCIKVNSNVPSKPIGFEIIRGANNRNHNAKEEISKKNIKYDYLCSVEGGFSLDENGIPFVVTYAIIENAHGKKSTGKSVGIRLRKDVFDYVKNGGSLNKIIDEIDESKNNKEDMGITGFLTNGLYNRDKFDKDAIISALIPFIFEKNRNLLSEKIKENNLIEE
jgi:inosine/xanthosine triphosphatase